MKLKFALSLSFRGIALLRRTPKGWARIGEAALDAPDFDAEMQALNDTARGLHPGGHRVGLIIPNEQIRYLDLPDTADEARSPEAQVRAALDGATPYAVDDLSFDFTRVDGRLCIAAVANETLAEAEGFARDHGFVPLAAMAIAPDDAFDGAVFFGKSSGASGKAPARPTEAIKVIDADAKAFAPAAGEAASVATNDAPDDTPDDGEKLPVESAPEDSLVLDDAPSRPQDAEPEIAAESAPEEPVARDAAPEPSAPEPEPTAEIKAPEPGVAAEPDAIADKAEPAPVPDDASNPVAAKSEGPAFAEPKDSDEQADPGTPAPEVSPPSAPELPPAAKPQFASIRASRDAGSVPPAARSLKLDPGADALGGRRAPPPVTPPNQAKEAGITKDKIDIDEPPAAPAATGGAAGMAKRFLGGKRAGGKAGLDAEDVTPELKPVSPQPPRATVAGALGKPGPVEDDAAPLAPKPPAPWPISVSQGGKDKAPRLPDAPKVAVPTPAEPVLRKPAPVETGAAEARPVVVSDRAKAVLNRINAMRTDYDDVPATPGAAALPGGPARAVTTSEEERERMTVFGARNNDYVGGKPRFLGLMLTAALLIFLAGVAAWASVFLDDGLARFFRSAPEEPVIAAAPDVPEVPAIPDTVALPDTDPVAPEEEEEPVQVAALESAPEATTDAAPLSVPVEARALTPEEAAATYAATGIWQRAPTTPLLPPLDGVDDVYVASIDPDVQQFDAVALPDPLDMAQEPVLEAPGLPPPAGMFFDFDDRGLVRATPEGALSPEGLRIFAGLPPAVPPLRGAADAPPAAAPEVDPAVDAGPRLDSIRPEARPDDIIEQRERATFRGISLSELAAFRPVMRPKTAQEVAVDEQPDAPATRLAISRSLIPVTRPRNMAAIVRRAERNAERQVVRTASAAAVAPRTVRPDVPTTTSVARAATVSNAINLNRVNLIGVYGTPSNRRALVRLSNGRYLKVKVGDRMDGGRVSAINDSELRYNKGGRNVTLKMPRG